ncbi:hypothetical protein FRB94_000892, partial [Tulasnella sp. JGI-2019a]
VTSGKLCFRDAVAVVIWTLWTSISLGSMFGMCAIGTLPPVIWLWKLFNGNIGLVNANIPHFFESLSPELANAAKEKLSAPADPKAYNPRTFDLDIAAFMLQISAIMYERDPKGTNRAVQDAQARSNTVPIDRKELGGEEVEKKTAPDEPGAVVGALFTRRDADHIIDLLDAGAVESEAPIRKFVKRYELQFAVVSELQTTSQAYCSLFWEPRGKWVVVAFKGTDPTSFEEWSTGFTTTFVDSARDIPGFKYLHEGFKERVLPAEGRQPYYTIAAAVKVVCEELVKGHDKGTKINVWFTGHSLGTAMGSITYAKALVAKDDFGPHALIRDAYCFATPVVCDIKSRLFFNSVMSRDTKTPRTLWRITNRNDFVATGIPDFGDRRVEGYGADNMFNFSHLGVEIFMKDHPTPSQVAGDAVRAPSGFEVHVTSKFDAFAWKAMRDDLKKKGYVQPFYITWLQYIPVLGSMAAHGTTNYWEQLHRVGLMPAVARE